jgi:hypothetical protein
VLLASDNGIAIRRQAAAKKGRELGWLGQQFLMWKVLYNKGLSIVGNSPLIHRQVGIELRFDLGLRDRQAMLQNTPHSLNLNCRLAGLGEAQGNGVGQKFNIGCASCARSSHSKRRCVDI